MTVRFATDRIRRPRPPTPSEIVRDGALFVLSTIIATVAAVYLDGRVGDATVILVAVVIAGTAYVLIYRLVFGRLPPIVGRPGRYSIPNAIGLFAAGFLALAESIQISVVFPLAMGFILIGGALSDYQWSRAEAHRP